MVGSGYSNGIGPVGKSVSARRRPMSNRSQLAGNNARCDNAELSRKQVNQTERGQFQSPNDGRRVHQASAITDRRVLMAEQGSRVSWSGRH